MTSLNNEIIEQTIDAVFNNANELAGLYEQEDDEGNVEYKQHLIEPTEERFERLISQTRHRLTKVVVKHYTNLVLQIVENHLV